MSSVVYMYGIYDKESEVYSQPFPAKNDVLAVRQFMLALDSFPESIRTSFRLDRLFGLSDDLIPDGSFRATISDGSEYDDWKSTHKKEDK